VNCPEICVNALISYFEFHTKPVNVFLTEKDIPILEKQSFPKDLLHLHIIDKQIATVYQTNGHLGTAILWYNAILKNSSSKLIHFDSDVIFKENMIDLLESELETHDIVGGRRCYQHNANNREDIRNLSDVVTTYCFGFNPQKITKNYLLPQNSNLLISMIRGFTNPIGHPILDFFDPVSFDIIKNGGTIFFIDYEIIGGFNNLGSRNNSYPILNKQMDYGSHIIHFSSVGSGLNFFKAIQEGKSIRVPETYVKYALGTLNIYKYLLFNEMYEDIPDTIKEVKMELDKSIHSSFVSF
jgi:hypothetical protein